MYNQDNHKTYSLLSMRDESFFQELGQRIASLRQNAGLSQIQLAQQLGLKQQTLATYESATRRIPSSLLIPLTEIFAIALEELLGAQRPKAKRGPAPKLQNQIEQVSHLSKSKQKFVSDFLETVLQGA